jgi:hypothetical protein
VSFNLENSVWRNRASSDASRTPALTQTGRFGGSVQTSRVPVPAMPEADLRRFLRKPVPRLCITRATSGCSEPTTCANQRGPRFVQGTRASSGTGEPIQKQPLTQQEPFAQVPLILNELIFVD